MGLEERRERRVWRSGSCNSSQYTQSAATIKSKGVEGLVEELEASRGEKKDEHKETTEDQSSVPHARGAQVTLEELEFASMLDWRRGRAEDKSVRITREPQHLESLIPVNPTPAPSSIIRGGGDGGGSWLRRYEARWVAAGQILDDIPASGSWTTLTSMIVVTWGAVGRKGEE